MYISYVSQSPHYPALVTKGRKGIFWFIHSESTVHLIVLKAWQLEGSLLCWQKKSSDGFYRNGTRKRIGQKL